MFTLSAEAALQRLVALGEGAAQRGNAEKTIDERACPERELDRVGQSGSALFRCEIMTMAEVTV